MTALIRKLRIVGSNMLMDLAAWVGGEPYRTARDQWIAGVDALHRAERKTAQREDI